MTAEDEVLCPQCGHRQDRHHGASGNHVGSSPACPPNSRQTSYDTQCSFCYSHYKSGDFEVRVQGSNADEVQRVGLSLIQERSRELAAEREKRRLRNPWFSGTFYLTALIFIITLFLVAASVVSVWALPVILLGAGLLLSIVGALQLRQDDRLSQKNFVRLMADALKRLPSVVTHPGTEVPEKQ
jgi:hypothetical protein